MGDKRRIGTFVWRGWLERVPMDVLKLEESQGGYGFVDIGKKADALLIKNVFNMSSKDNMHLKYWLQISLVKKCGWIKDCIRAPVLTEHFRSISKVIKAETERMDEITKETAKKMTTKIVYPSVSC